MKNIIIITMAVVMLLVGETYAQNISYATKLSDVILSGRIIDSLIKNRPQGRSTVTIQISQYPFSHPGIQSAKNEIYEADVSYNEAFNIKISAPAKRFYMYIYYLQDFAGTAATNDMSWSSIDNIYMLEAGDHIHVDLARDFFRFSGKGSERLNCESEVYKHSFNGQMIAPNISEELGNLANHGNYKQYYSILNRGKDSCFKLQAAIVKKYRTRLGNELSSIMLANCFGIRYFWEIKGARQMSANYPGLYEQTINSDWYKKIDLNPDKIDPSILVQAPIYVDFLFEKIRMDSYFESDGSHQVPFYYKKTFEVIKNDFQGIIRDKLLALFFITNSRFPTSMDYLDEAIQLCGQSMYKEILIDLKAKKSKNIPFFPFELPDTKGKIVKLSDFFKKVVILDFWFTGCENCMILHKNMSAIHDKYKDNPNVVFVSVSIDKNKQQWIQSVNSSKYTDTRDVNLFTQGEGIRHPLIANYAISSFPTIFILKGGKIFSPDPPRPNNPSLTKGNTKRFLDLIDTALNSKPF